MVRHWDIHRGESTVPRSLRSPVVGGKLGHFVAARTAVQIAPQVKSLGLSKRLRAWAFLTLSPPISLSLLNRCSPKRGSSACVGLDSPTNSLVRSAGSTGGWLAATCFALWVGGCCGKLALVCLHMATEQSMQSSQLFSPHSHAEQRGLLFSPSSRSNNSSNRLLPLSVSTTNGELFCRVGNKLSI